MMGNNIDDLRRQIQLLGFLYTIFYMRLYYRYRQAWRKVVMPVVSLLVLDKEVGLVNLADILVVTSHPCQKTICLDVDTCCLGQVSYQD